MDAIWYIAATGCQWAQLPKHFPPVAPPVAPVQYHFYPMRDNGLLDVVNAVPVAWARVSTGRKSAPVAAFMLDGVSMVPMFRTATGRRT